MASKTKDCCDYSATTDSAALLPVELPTPNPVEELVGQVGGQQQETNLKPSEDQ